jgi:DNA-binding response OmpR family regulator
MTQVLVVDDDLGTLETYGAILRLSGFQVETADSGAKGLSLALKGRFDLILADLRVPELSGVDLLRQLREAHVPSPLVIMTAFGSTESAVQAMKLGATDYVEKPLDAGALLRTVERALPESRRLKQSFTPRPEHILSHAAARWATRLIVPVLDSPTDLTTISAWARHIAMSPGALKNWCRTANVSPKRSLTLARLLRILAMTSRTNRRAEDLLNVVDRRTIAKILRLGGIDDGNVTVSVDAFLDHQRLIIDRMALEELTLALKSRFSYSGRDRV